MMLRARDHNQEHRVRIALLIMVCTNTLRSTSGEVISLKADQTGSLPVRSTKEYGVDALMVGQRAVTP